MCRLGQFVLCLVLVGAFMASADQLQWNSRAVCEQALSAIKRATWVVSYCSLCGNDVAEIWSVKGATIAPTSADGLYELVISGSCLYAFSLPVSAPAVHGVNATSLEAHERYWLTTAIDLAYTYVRTEDGTLRPLGRILGLPCLVGLETMILPERHMRRVPGGS